MATNSKKTTAPKTTAKKATTSPAKATTVTAKPAAAPATKSAPAVKTITAADRQRLIEQAAYFRAEKQDTAITISWQSNITGTRRWPRSTLTSPRRRSA
jgi:hypothetical protein